MQRHNMNVVCLDYIQQGPVIDISLRLYCNKFCSQASQIPQRQSLGKQCILYI